MARETLLGDQVKCLLSGVSDHGTRHLTEIESDLVQTNILLGEAIEKLSASFMAIHHAVTAQQNIVDSLIAGAPPGNEIAEKLQAGQNEIGLHVNAAVTGLQFQDMTNQLIGRTLRRAAGLRELLEGLAAGNAGIRAENDVGEISAALSVINNSLDEQSKKLESALWKAVCQTHMESGDIELF